MNGKPFDQRMMIVAWAWTPVANTLQMMTSSLMHCRVIRQLPKAPKATIRTKGREHEGAALCCVWVCECLAMNTEWEKSFSEDNWGKDAEINQDKMNESNGLCLEARPNVWKLEEEASRRANKLSIIYCVFVAKLWIRWQHLDVVFHFNACRLKSQARRADVTGEDWRAEELTTPHHTTPWHGMAWPGMAERATGARENKLEIGVDTE